MDEENAEEAELAVTGRYFEDRREIKNAARRAMSATAVTAIALLGMPG